MTELAALQERYPDGVTFRFGDGPELCAELIALVRVGKKTSTCGAARDFGPDGEPMPVVGRRDIVLNWDGTPALVVETVEVRHVRFCDVDLAFALDEGETETLAEWRHDHQAYLERNGGFTPDMMLVCERFRLVEDMASAVP